VVTVNGRVLASEKKSGVRYIVASNRQSRGAPFSYPASVGLLASQKGSLHPLEGTGFSEPKSLAHAVRWGGYTPKVSSSSHQV